MDAAVAAAVPHLHDAAANSLSARADEWRMNEREDRHNQSGGVRKTALLLAFAAAAVYATFDLIVVTR